jgi:di/tricarboxylate transporter
MSEAVPMTPQIAWVLGILALTVFLFVSERLRVDVTAITIMVILGLSGLITPDEVFSGFSSNAVISIIAVMIIGAGLDKTGVMNQISRPILRLAGNTEGRLITIISATVGIISSFMQNIGAAALFMPAVRRIADRTNIPLSRLLMPMGFCAILGGTVTLVGSSPLILLNDLVETANQNLPPHASPMKTFGLFEVTPIGLALIATGIVYFIVLGRFVLPSRSGAQPATPSTMDYLTRTYGISGDIFEATIHADSPLIGTTVDYVRVRSGRKLSIVARQHDGDTQIAPPGDTPLQAGDVLGLLGAEADIQDFAEQNQLEISPTLSRFSDALAPGRAGVAEIVIRPRSELIGKTTSEIRFRQRFKAGVLAIYSGEQTITENIRTTPLRSGDALLVHSSWDDLALLDADKNFIVMSDYPRQDLELRPGKVRFALLSFAVALGLVLFSPLKLSVALMAGAVGMVLTGVMRIDEAYQSVDWRTVFLLAGLIPLGIAVDQTHTAAWIAHHVLAIVGEVPQIVMLTVIAVLATAFTLVMSNVGATVLLVPLAVEIALEAGMDARAFALVVGIATSNSFLLPTHQVNALIMGPGGYRNRDFVRAGGIMSLLFLVVLVTMLSLFY